MSLLSTVVTALAVVPAVVAIFCGEEFVCDNESAVCSEGSTCINPSGRPLDGCCVPNGLILDEATLREQTCSMAFACDDIAASCDEESECFNPSGLPLAGCCIPKKLREEAEAAAASTSPSTTCDGECTALPQHNVSLRTEHAEL